MGGARESGSARLLLMGIRWGFCVGLVNVVLRWRTREWFKLQSFDCLRFCRHWCRSGSVLRSELLFLWTRFASLADAFLVDTSKSTRRRSASHTFIAKARRASARARRPSKRCSRREGLRAAPPPPQSLLRGGASVRRGRLCGSGGHRRRGIGGHRRRERGRTHCDGRVGLSLRDNTTRRRSARRERFALLLVVVVVGHRHSHLRSHSKSVVGGGGSAEGEGEDKATTRSSFLLRCSDRVSEFRSTHRQKERGQTLWVLEMRGVKFHVGGKEYR